MVRPPTTEPASAATFDRLANPWACLKSFSANSILDISKNFSALQYSYGAFVGPPNAFQ